MSLNTWQHKLTQWVAGAGPNRNGKRIAFIANSSNMLSKPCSDTLHMLLTTAMAGRKDRCYYWPTMSYRLVQSESLKFQNIYTFSKFPVQHHSSVLVWYISLFFSFHLHEGGGEFRPKEEMRERKVRPWLIYVKYTGWPPSIIYKSLSKDKTISL